jgi:hypothetical protein
MAMVVARQVKARVEVYHLAEQAAEFRLEEAVRVVAYHPVVD